MEIFKNGKRTYLVFKKDIGRRKALSKANEYFKEKVSELEIESGRMIDEETIKIGTAGTHWVVSRKGKK